MDLEELLKVNETKLRIAMDTERELRDDLVGKKLRGETITEDETTAHHAWVEQVSQLLREAHDLIAKYDAR